MILFAKVLFDELFVFLFGGLYFDCGRDPAARKRLTYAYVNVDVNVNVKRKRKNANVNVK